MKPSPFVHHAPTSVEEATAALARVGYDGKVLAGGQSLIPMLSMRLAAPAHLIDINRVVGLDGIEVREDCVRVGATVRHSQLERSDEADAANPLLRQALRNVAHPAIRNRGTTVGSIAHADAAGEMPSVAVLTDAIVEVASAGGTREIAAGDFFAGPLETTLNADELVTAVRFGRFPAGTVTGFVESARRSGDYAVAGVALALTIVGGEIASAKASFVSVTDIPDVLDLSAVLAGPADAIDDDSLVTAVREHVQPEGDIHASADYRRMLAAELTRRLVHSTFTTADLGVSA